MADIDLERKESSGGGWLWGLLALLAVAAIAWWAIDEMGEDDDRLAEDYAAETDVAANEEFGDEARVSDRETGIYEDETGAYDGAEEMDAAQRGAAGASFDEVAGDPQRFVGEQVTATVRVAETGSERGFWIEPEGGGERMFVIADPAGNGNELPDLTSGQTLQLDGAWVRGAEELTNVAGQLDEGTRQALDDQDAFLTVDPANVRVLEEQRS